MIINLIFLLSQNKSYALQKDRDSEITDLHSALLAQQANRDALENSNTKLREEISGMEEKLRQRETENLTNSLQEHTEEMEVLAGAYQRTRDDCETMMSVEVNFHVYYFYTSFDLAL